MKFVFQILLSSSQCYPWKARVNLGLCDEYSVSKAFLLQVIDLIKPIASVKKLSINLILAPDMPTFAVGDEKRLMQTILNIMGNAVKFTKEGHVSIRVSVMKRESLGDWVPPELYPASLEGRFYLKIQVKKHALLSAFKFKLFFLYIFG